MPKNEKENIDVMNKKSREAGTEMQQSLFDTVTKANRAQREKEEQAEAGRRKQLESAKRDRRYSNRSDKNPGTLQRFEQLSYEMKRTLSAMDSLATILFAIGAQAEALKDVMQYQIEKSLESKFGPDGINVRKHIVSFSSILFKKLVQAVTDNMTDPDVYLPGVIHYVELDGNSKVKDEPLRFDSKIFVTPDQNKIFNASFKNWLNKNGYDYDEKPNPDQNKPSIRGPVKDIKTGAIIDKKTFEALRDDPVHGLTRYLKDEWKMQNIKQEKARVDAPKEEPPPKKEGKKRAQNEDHDNDQEAENAPRPRP